MKMTKTTLELNSLSWRILLQILSPAFFNKNSRAAWLHVFKNFNWDSMIDNLKETKFGSCFTDKSAGRALPVLSFMCVCVHEPIQDSNKEAATTTMATTGGIRQTEGSENDLEIHDLARFAVDDHNTKHNALLEFKKVTNVKQQVVAGTMYHLTLEAVEGGKNKAYEAKVWVKPWLNFKEVQEFKHVCDV